MADDLFLQEVLQKEGLPNQARLLIDGHVVDAYVTHLHHTSEGGAIRAEQIAGLIAFVD